MICCAEHGHDTSHELSASNLPGFASVLSPRVTKRVNECITPDPQSCRGDEERVEKRARHSKEEHASLEKKRIEAVKRELDRRFAEVSAAHEGDLKKAVIALLLEQDQMAAENALLEKEEMVPLVLLLVLTTTTSASNSNSSSNSSNISSSNGGNNTCTPLFLFLTIRPPRRSKLSG